MANLLAGKTVVPELVQHDATAARIFLESSQLLDEPARSGLIRTELLKIRRSLGRPGASDRAAIALLGGAREEALQ
jgi:lipid-A-disaccharide synthase